MANPKHLRPEKWPEADRNAFAAAFMPGDIFDSDGGAGNHLAAGTRRFIETGCRRWLGYLQDHDPEAMKLAPAERITQKRVMDFVIHLRSQMRVSSVCTYLSALAMAAQLIAPDKDWLWLKRLKSRLALQSEPQDRFARLVPPPATLDLGFRLMDEPDASQDIGRQLGEIRYRDGLILAMLSVWPIRRRSLASLTISSHIRRHEDTITIQLNETDVKSKRPQVFKMPDLLAPYMVRYLDDIRPKLLKVSASDALWISQRARPLSPGRMYDAIRGRVLQGFSRDMGLHDFRRAAATYIAMEFPEKAGLIPGVLQHASPEIGQQRYNLARSTEASRRFTAIISERRSTLRIRAGSTKG